MAVHMRVFRVPSENGDARARSICVAAAFNTSKYMHTYTFVQPVNTRIVDTNELHTTVAGSRPNLHTSPMQPIPNERSRPSARIELIQFPVRACRVNGVLIPHGRWPAGASARRLLNISGVKDTLACPACCRNDLHL